MARKKSNPNIDARQVVKVTLTYSDLGRAILDIRLRGEETWMYFENIEVCIGQSVTICDNQPMNEIPEDTNIKLTIIPRGDALDKVIQEHG